MTVVDGAFSEVCDSFWRTTARRGAGVHAGTRRCHPETRFWPKDLNVRITSHVVSVLEVDVEVLRFAQDDTRLF